MSGFIKRNNIILKRLLYLTFTLLILNSSAWAQRYELIWSDEFDQAEFDDNTWTKWDGTAFNNEYQYYTPRDTNVHVNDGMLYLVGLRENYGGRQWTSSRIKTQDHFEFQYGKVEIRAKLPAGKGLWPAFWMLGSNIDQVGWPYSGEIDIMEYRGHLTAQTSGTVHFSGVPPGSGNPNNDRKLIGHEYDLPKGSFADDFHLFQFEWTDSTMVWYIDDVEFFKLNRKSIENQTSYYPFDQPFYLILNLAIGGNFLGDYQPDGSTPNRNEVIVDYVRVFQDVNKNPKVSLSYDDRVQTEPLIPVNLEADVTDEDGTIEKVVFYLNDKLIGKDLTPPYSIQWLPRIEGCYELGINAYDNENGVGKNTQSVIFEVGTGCTQRPYQDQPGKFPGKLQLEYFDYGGPEVSYFDTTPDTNLGNAQGNDFRITEAVDIIPDPNEPGNYLITDTKNGEWTNYTIEVEQTGIYDFKLRSVPGSGLGRVDFRLDGQDWIYFNRITARDDSVYFTKTRSNIELKKGTYELQMKIAIEGGGVKPDYLNAIFKEATSNEESGNLKPAITRLNQNYPNPFNPITQISFDLLHDQIVKLDVYNSLGQHIITLHDGRLIAGNHHFTFNAKTLSSGIYYYQLSSDAGIFTRKMILMK